MPWDEVMSKFGKGKLKSGGSGKPVKSRKQAVAIMLSEKRASASKPEYRSLGKGSGAVGWGGSTKPTKRSGLQKTALKQSSPKFPSKGGKNLKGILG